jgi:hypothetical protein
MFAVSTGLDSFLDPENIGPMYPFVGTEVIVFGIALFLWLAWHFLQARGETREHRAACAMYEDIGLDRVMDHGPSSLPVSHDEWGGRPSAVNAGPDTGAVSRTDPGRPPRES